MISSLVRKGKDKARRLGANTIRDQVSKRTGSKRLTDAAVAAFEAGTAGGNPFSSTAAQKRALHNLAHPYGGRPPVKSSIKGATGLHRVHERFIPIYNEDGSLSAHGRGSHAHAGVIPLDMRIG